MIRTARPAAFALMVSLLLAIPAMAQYFPLPQTTGSTTAQEGTAPFLIPTGMSQTKITDRNTLNLQGLAPSFGTWDMVAFSADSRYIFIPSESSSGGGLFRYDTVTGTSVNIIVGNGSGVRESNPANWNPANDELSRIDPATLTPWNTVLIAEETTGGRLFEVLNPFANSGFNVVWRSNIPAVGHEGLRFDENGTLYFIDEDNSGSVYKFVPATPGDLSVGQTFVLSVNAFSGDASANWSAASNIGQVRTGAATWIPMTDSMGNALTSADPFAYVTTTGGRTAANELNATPYGRPEDVDFGRLANGNQVLYFTATSENTIYSVELVSNSQATVRTFVNYDTINEGTGLDVSPNQNDPFTSPGAGTNLRSPDNLAVDAWGNVYIIEDNNPGDIWQARDLDADGVAESVALFVSLGVAGSEPSGMIFDPNNPYRFICCIQHPSSGNDALWSFDTRPYDGTNDDLELYVGVNSELTTGPARYVKPARAFENIQIHLDSPNGNMAFSPVIFFYDLFVTGFPPAPVAGAPFLHVDIPTSVVVVDGRIPGIFSLVLPPQGMYFAATTPPGLVGFSVMMQGGVFNQFSNNGIAAITDGHEIQFTF